MAQNATNRWLDRLAAWDKERGGTGTDYRLAQLLGIERQRVSRYRREADQAMGDDTCLVLAQLLDVRPMIVIAEVNADRSRDARMRRVWAEVAKKACVILPLSASGAAMVPERVWGAEMPSPSGSGNRSATVYYVKSRTGHRRRHPIDNSRRGARRQRRRRQRPLPFITPGRARPLSERTVTPTPAGAV